MEFRPGADGLRRGQVLVECNEKAINRFRRLASAVCYEFLPRAELKRVAAAKLCNHQVVWRLGDQIGAKFVGPVRRSKLGARLACLSDAQTAPARNRGRFISLCAISFPAER